MSRRPPLRIALAAVVLWAFSPERADADLFSPGELSRPHASLEGLKNCTKCHAAGQQLTPDTCLACHQELKSRVADGKGFHGRIPAADRACETCHHEHQGREYEMVEWPGGRKSSFDHNKAGWALAGAHKKLDCTKCHETRRIQDDAVRKLLLDQPKRETFLGLGKRCTDCHFDEHRGQFKADCQQCHTEGSWKPAPGFDHAKTAYPLEFKHKTAECAKCHVARPDESTPANAFPAPKSKAFATFTGIAHGKCTDCHKDPHDDRFGQRCDTCHTPQDWHAIKGQNAERQFHEKTAFPLKGAHSDVACAACHGTPMKLKGLPHARCTDCHFDAHPGQFDQAADCSQCHNITAFRPSSFDVLRHAKTAFPLAGKHAPVACVECHVPDPTLANRVPANVRKALQRSKRKELVSFLRFNLPMSGGCQSCHDDAHAGQLPGLAVACDRCHSVEGFDPARFELEDHAKTAYPLAGAHQAVDCRLCHVPDPKLEARRPPADAKRPERSNFSLISLHPTGPAKGCVGCHVDPHAGQFASKSQAKGCESCHETTSFVQVKFDHDRDSRFALSGRHATAACNACHVPERVGATSVVRYRPIETTCTTCHADVHLGQFATSPGEPTDCARCHGTAEFKPIQGFQHAPPFTRFELTGKHATAACNTCHVEVTVTGNVATRRYKPLPTSCEGCHVDQHDGAFRGFEP